MLISKTPFDCTSDVIVPVIASFDSNGRIKPIYVRIYGAAYKVDSSHMISNYIHTMEFTCKLIDGDSLRPLMLTYHKQEGMWSVRI